MRTRGWYLVRLEFAVAIVGVGLVALLVFTAPSTMGGGPIDPLASWATWLGIVGIAIGFAAMIRIFRASPEAYKPSWRSFRARR